MYYHKEQSCVHLYLIRAAGQFVYPPPPSLKTLVPKCTKSSFTGCSRHFVPAALLLYYPFFFYFPKITEEIEYTFRYWIKLESNYLKKSIFNNSALVVCLSLITHPVICITLLPLQTSLPYSLFAATLFSLSSLHIGCKHW